DYNFNLSHHPSKVNVVVDALSRKPLYIGSSFVCEITYKRMKLGLLKITSDMMEKSRKGNEVMRFQNKIHVLYVIELRKLILQKGLSSGLKVQLGATRMYQNLREIIVWYDLEEE
ncbi:hypothetical protein CR513_17458, partial [Mucuna pruriens]